MSKKKNRDDFTQPIKDILARRVGYKCSKPDCRRTTSGPNSLSNQTTNIGVAAHITAAAPGGPRYDERLTEVERKSVENGIWLCNNHSTLIDKDVNLFTVDILKEWKLKAENEALEELVNENYRLRKEIDEVINSIEGKNSYPILDFMGIPDVNRLYFQLALSNSKHKPLYDVVLQIHDPEEVEASKINGNPTLKTFKLHERINLGNLPPSLSTPIKEPALFPHKGYFHYFAYIGTRNGVYHQEIYCFPKNGAWEVATKLQKYSESEPKRIIIYESIPEHYKHLNWKI